MVIINLNLLSLHRNVFVILFTLRVIGQKLITQNSFY